MTTDKPVADDELPEPAGYFYEFDSPLGLHRSFRHARYNGYEPDRSVAYYTTDQMRAAIARERESMNELRRAVAELVGEDQETWPDHGNAPLAIGATVAILHAGCERAEAEISTLRQQLADAKRDAERYRFIRSNCECMGERPDDAIDAAIAAGAQK